MKNITLKVWLLSIAILMAGSASAQYDDMYFDPEKDRGFFDGYQANKNTRSGKNSYDYTNRNRGYEDDYAYEDEYYYDDQEYAYYDDYDFHYSSRVRRFHQPYYGFGFFDPVYVDMSYYDPFMMPGATVLIYDDVFAFNNWYRFNRFNRWNRWNSFNVGFGIGYGFGAFNRWGNPWASPWGFNGMGWNRWNNPWDPWNRWGGGFNSWYGPGMVNNFYNFGGGFYCPPTWGNNYVYNSVNAVRSNTVYAPRTTGVAYTPAANGREIRRETPKDVTNNAGNVTGATPMPNTGRAQRVEGTDQAVAGRTSTEPERIRIFDDTERARVFDPERVQREANRTAPGRGSYDDRSIDRDSRSINRNSNATQRQQDTRRYEDTRRRNDTYAPPRTRENTNPTRTRESTNPTRVPQATPPRTRSAEPTRRSGGNSPSGTYRGSDNRSTSPSWNNSRSSSPSSSPSRMGSGSSRSSSPSMSPSRSSSGSSMGSGRSSSGSSSGSSRSSSGSSRSGSRGN